MNLTPILDETAPELLRLAEELAQRLGFTIRYEALRDDDDTAARSGTCRVQQNRLILIEPRSSVPERLALLRRILRNETATDHVFMPPRLRQWLQQ